ncbi:MAG: hypothetical protein V1856_02485 [Candidatus Liptonbacteria bacterium]
MSKNGFVPIVLVLLLAGIIVFGMGGYIFYKNKVVETPAPQPVQPEARIVGNDRDAHGCIGSAGYSWCEIKQRCLRPWEEKCEAENVSSTNKFTNSSSTQNNIINSSTSYPCAYAPGGGCPSGYVCYDSQYRGMGPNGVVLGEQKGDLLCHKSCNTDHDCVTGTCVSREIWQGDVGGQIRFCQ